MKKNLFSSPDHFSISPFLALLPVRGSVSELPRMTSSFYARYEKVQSLKKNLGDNREMQRRLLVEEVMLKQVLDRLSVNTEEHE